MRHAIELTLPDFSYEKIEDYLISTVEMENLLALEHVQCTRAAQSNLRFLRDCFLLFSGAFYDAAHCNDVHGVSPFGFLPPEGIPSGGFCNGAPDFIIEIVSPSNPADDYIRKLYYYKNYGVREYWIIDHQIRMHYRERCIT